MATTLELKQLELDDVNARIAQFNANKAAATTAANRNIAILENRKTALEAEIAALAE